MDHQKRTRSISIAGSSTFKSHITLHLPVSVPISVERRTSCSADGIGSPTDLAYTPPGVLTKVENIVRTKTPARHSPDKMICACCGRNAQCLCKKCTLEKLTFYAKKETLYRSSVEKDKLQKEIEASILHRKITEDISAKSNRIILLKAKIRDVRARNDMNKVEIRILRSKRIIKEEQLLSVLESHEKKKVENTKRKQRRHEALAVAENAVAKLRRDLCFQAGTIFPVAEMEVAFTDTDTKNPSAWTLTKDEKLEGIGFQVRCDSAYINDAKRQDLVVDLTEGREASEGTKKALAALTYIYHLVHLLAFIFNATLPASFSLQEFSSRERWESKKMVQDWQGLCDAVMILCLHIGVPTNRILWSQPFSNLIEIVSYVVNEESNICSIERKPEITVTALSQIVERTKTRTTEEDENWEIVN